MAKYKFKGYTITNCGYHQPDHCVWWEAVDENGGACFHGNTLRDVEFMILDYEWEQKLRKKEEEIELLKASKQPGNTAAMREALKAVVAVGYPHNFQREAPHIRGYCYDITKAIEKCFAALSAPPCNCDVGTAEEQHRRFVEYCNACDCPMGCIHRKQFIGMLDTRCASMLKCYIRWSQMPYEAAKGGAE